MGRHAFHDRGSLTLAVIMLLSCSYVSSILISVNPFKLLPIYTPDVLETYRQVRSPLTTRNTCSEGRMYSITTEVLDAACAEAAEACRGD